MVQYQNFQINDDIAGLVASVLPDVRRIKDMLRVYADLSWTKIADPETPVYYMHRHVDKKDGLRYDITIIPPLLCGNEYNKTLGHYHLGSGELYIVLQGQATFLVQERSDQEDESIKDCYFVGANAGQACTISRSAAHFTINETTKPLVMANWVKADCDNDYSPVVRMRGACYYRLNSGWAKNDCYKVIPPLRQVQPLSTIPQDLEFLK